MDGGIRQHYEQNGYAVVRDLVPHDLIDGILSAYSAEIRSSRAKFYRQNTNRYQVNRFDDHGHVRQSFLDPHDWSDFPRFRDGLMSVFLSKAVLSTLTSLTGANVHRLMQSMFFDANTATPGHQDWFYLDSVPPGHLLAGWFALEDIDERAGRFYVIAGSQTESFHDPDKTISHAEWLKKISAFVRDNRQRLVAPELRKGDVLFWNSRTVHGSLPTRDGKYSRKSVTSHYLPDGHEFGNIFKTKDWIKYKKYKGHEYYANQPGYSRRAEMESMVKVFLYDKPFLMRMARKLQKRSLSR